MNRSAEYEAWNDSDARMMTMPKKDNSNFAGKLALREHFLQKYHFCEASFRENSPVAANRPLVLDAYHGQGLLWQELCKKYPCKVIGLDVKDVNGILRMSNLKYMRRFDLPYEVIDLDAYGEPWQTWDCVLQKSTQSAITVFLTQCRVGIGGGGVSRLWKSWCGFPLAAPNWLAWRARDYMRQIALSRCLDKWNAIEAKQVMEKNIIGSPSRRWYIGLRLIRGTNSATDLST